MMVGEAKEANGVEEVDEDSEVEEGKVILSDERQITSPLPNISYERKVSSKVNMKPQW